MSNVSINRETVKKIGTLSRLRIKEQESEKYSESISAVINWFDMLDEVDVSDAPQEVLDTADATPLRADLITDGGVAEKVVSNAKDSKFNMFSVPKVVE